MNASEISFSAIKLSEPEISLSTIKLCEKIEMLYKRVERYSSLKRFRRNYCNQILILERQFEKSILKDAIAWFKQPIEEIQTPAPLPLAKSINAPVDWLPKVGLKIQAISDGKKGEIVKIIYQNSLNPGLSEIKVKYNDGTSDTPYANQLIALEPSPLEPASPPPKKEVVAKSTPSVSSSIEVPQSPPKKEMANSTPPPQVAAQVVEPLPPEIDDLLDWDVVTHREVSLNGRKGLIIRIVSPQPNKRSGGTEVVIRYSDNYTDETCFARELVRISPPVHRSEEPQKPKLSSADFKIGTELHKAWVAKDEIASVVNGLKFRGDRIRNRDRYTYAGEFAEMDRSSKWVEKITGYYAKLETLVTKAEHRKEEDEYPPTVVIRQIRTSTRGSFFAFAIGEGEEDIIFMTSFLGERDEVICRLAKAKVGLIVEEDGNRIIGFRKKLEAFVMKAENRKEGDEYPPTVIIRQRQAAPGSYFAFVIGASNEEIFVTSFLGERDQVICRLMRARVGVIIEQEGDRYRPKIIADGKIETHRIPVAQPKRA